ncbi:MAG: TetR/AcrR family transcriptional regulator [Pseudomonadota bacterium]
MSKESTEASYADRRRLAIEEAAYLVLAEKGYKGASMLEIARRAGASNETLYKWYGNKQGLFKSLVEDNAGRITSMIDAALNEARSDADMDVLIPVGERLLSVLTSERAIALNRAAAGDVHDTSTLGKALSANGRETVLPFIARLFEQAVVSEALDSDNASDIAETWLALLVGDLQIRVVTGQTRAPSEIEIKRRARKAVAQLKALYLAQH